jgi:hypothetical protein
LRAFGSPARCSHIRSYSKDVLSPRVRLGRTAERVVGGHRLAEGEAVAGDERHRIDPAGGDEVEHGRDREGVDQAGGDGDVLDLQVLLADVTIGPGGRGVGMSQ